MDTAAVTAEQSARIELGAWSEKSKEVTKEMDWPEAKAAFDNGQFDFLYRKGDHWYGYVLPWEHLAMRPIVKGLTRTAYNMTRTIA